MLGASPDILPLGADPPRSNHPAMGRNGSITVGDLVGKLDVLRVECTRCDRKGQYPVAKLLAELGPDAMLTYWRERIIADCPKQQSVSNYDRCGAHCPDLRKVFPAKPVDPSASESAQKVKRRGPWSDPG